VTRLAPLLALVLVACGYESGECMLLSECEPCVQQAGCAFCLETNECAQVESFCPGDRAIQPIECEEESARTAPVDAGD
jgi:hypothetical protein